jgi:hypothetical protein
MTLDLPKLKNFHRVLLQAGLQRTFQRGTRPPKPDSRVLQDYDFHIGKAGLIRQSRNVVCSPRICLFLTAKFRHPPFL